jgi:O-antigen ligase
MLTKLYFLSAGIIAFLEILNPVYGICFLTFSFLVSLRENIPGAISYHTNLILAVILFFSVLLRGFGFRQKWVLILGVFFVCANFLSAFFCGIGDEGTKYLTEYFKAVLFILIILGFISKKKDLMLLLKTLVFGGICNALYAIFEQISGRALTYEHAGRSMGLIGQPNRLAAVSIALVPIACFFFLRGENRLLRLFNIISICILITGIFYSVSRAGFLALLFVGACLVIKNRNKAATIAVLGIILIFFFTAAKSLFEQRGETIHTSASGKITIESSALSRLSFSRQAVMLWLRHPMLGVGPNRFAKASTDELGIRTRHVVHNTYFEVLSESGILGFLPFIGIYVLSFRAIARLRKDGNEFFSELAWYLKISLLGIIICTLFGSFQRLFLLWIYLVLPVVLEKISQIEKSEKGDNSHLLYN